MAPKGVKYGGRQHPTPSGAPSADISWKMKAITCVPKGIA